MAQVVVLVWAWLLLLLLLMLLEGHAHGFACGGDGRVAAPSEAAEVAESGGREQEAAVIHVFGDSYADTGNHDPNSPDASISKPWRYPYGVSSPGQPSGRYSDGGVLTDLYVSQTFAKPPLPFRTLNGDANARLNGINFAFGGSTIFPTSNALILDVSMQIQQLRTTIESGIVSIDDISKSKALFVISGNDYFAYGEQHPDFAGIQDYIPLVVDQMAKDLESLAEVGFRSFLVTTLAPIGCLPHFTHVNNYTTCIDMFNSLSAYHNSILEKKISNLQQNLTSTTFVTIDIFTAFGRIVQEGTLSLRPCCEGNCGTKNENGTNLYTLCSNPEETLYWDTLHPTNLGWKKVSSFLFSSL